MEKAALLLIVITLFFLVIIVGLLTVLIYKMFRQKNGPFINQPQSPEPTGEAPHPDISKTEFHPAIVERMKEVEKFKSARSELFCPNHREEPGEVMCAICDKIFCKACIKPFKNLHFCKEHLPIVMKYDWEEVLTIKTSTQDPENGVRLYDVKKDVFEKENIPSYIETHYKINVDHDFIETYLVVYGRKEELGKIKEKFSGFIEQ